MATRRLKFKPKPSIVNAGRRLREDLPALENGGHTDSSASKRSTAGSDDPHAFERHGEISDSNEKNILNESPTKIVIDLLHDSETVKLQSTCPSNISLCEQQNCEKELSTERNSLNDVQLNNGNEINSDKILQLQGNFSVTPSFLTDLVDQRTTNLSETSDTTHKTELINNSVNSCYVTSIDSDNQSITPPLSGTNNTSQTKQPIEDTSVNKSDSTKVLSRFGRSRCKPVISNASQSRTNNRTVNTVNLPNLVTNFRTASVIKSVQSEISKILNSSKEAESSKSIGLSNISDEINVVTSERKSDEVLNDNLPKNNEYNTNLNTNFKSLASSVDKNVFNKEGEEETIVSAKPSLDVYSIEASKNQNLSFKPNSSEKNYLSRKSSPLNQVVLSSVKTTTKQLVSKHNLKLTETPSRTICSSDEEDAKRIQHSKLNDKLGVIESDTARNKAKNSKRKRTRSSTFSKLGRDRMQKLSKKIKETDGAPDKSKLIMLDLIFYNPKTNPMTVKPTQTTVGKKSKKAVPVKQPVEEILEEQSVDDVEPVVEAMPVPQLKVGPDGQIILDPQSLVIETTGVEKSRHELELSEVVEESGTSGYYGKRKARTEWTANETLQFYRALSTIGSDFSLMTKLFPKRSRHELKLKFKREERTNLNLVDKAMTIGSSFEFQTLLQDFEKENAEIERKAFEKKLAKENAKKERERKKKEEKVKTKRRVLDKRIKLSNSAFREFSSNELDQLYKTRPQKKTLQKKKKPILKAEIISDSDEELVLSNSDSPEDDNISAFRWSESQSRQVHRRNTTTTLNECAEINETLKKKLACEKATTMNGGGTVKDKLGFELDSEDIYIPNNPTAYQLFGSPLRDPVDEVSVCDNEPAHEDNERSWNIVISTLPSLEETVLPDNVEDVSELSELGSFGQNDTALDLSTSIRSEIFSDGIRHVEHSLLDGNLISQSFKIIDQLTLNENNNEIRNIKENNSDTDLTDDETNENKIRLPSFELVNRSLPSSTYPHQVPYDTNTYHKKSLPDATNVNQTKESNDCHPNIQETEGNSNLYIANFFTDVVD